MSPNTAELQAALLAIRSRPAHRYWPDQLEQVLANPLQARLLRIEASLRRRRFKPHPFRAQLHSNAPNLAPVAIDHKRAAAGDRDD